jgi:hypothetical protein
MKRVPSVFLAALLLPVLLSAYGLLWPSTSAGVPVSGDGQGSGSPTGAGGSAKSVSAFAGRWTNFTDPAEGAFSMDVPQGWKIVGGVYRFGPLDPRAMVDMVSPDGKIDLRFGDAHVPPFATLSQSMRNLGWREGRPYSPNGAAQEIVANYRSGWVFADLYGQGRFGSKCQRLNLKSMKQADLVHPNEGPGKTTAGEVVYSCETGGGPFGAYVFAETRLVEMQGVGTWNVTWLYSFLAPQDQAGVALQTLIHSMSTFSISQQWEARQMQLTGQVLQVIMKQFQQNLANEHAHFERQQAQSQSLFDGIDRAIRGQDLTTDTVDGTQREVWTGTGAPHWINGLGDIVDSPTQPGSGYHQLNNQP